MKTKEPIDAKKENILLEIITENAMSVKITIAQMTNTVKLIIEPLYHVKSFSANWKNISVSFSTFDSSKY